MEIKDHVIDHKGYVLRGDSRGITVPWGNRVEVWTWCDKNNITVEYKGSLDKMDLWYVKNDRDRALFALRWA
jgi:hypothetical protein